jgi:hypothetical protein
MSERHGAQLTFADVDPIGRGQKQNEDRRDREGDGLLGQRSSCSTPTS